MPIFGCTSSDETLEIEIGEIPAPTNNEDKIKLDVVREIPGNTACGCTMEAAEITPLANGGDPDYSGVKVQWWIFHPRLDVVSQNKKTTGGHFIRDKISIGYIMPVDI